MEMEGVFSTFSKQRCYCRLENLMESRYNRIPGGSAETIPFTVMINYVVKSTLPCGIPSI